MCDCHDRIWGSIGYANRDPEVVGNAHAEVVGDDDILCCLSSLRLMRKAVPTRSESSLLFEVRNFS
jgi:hypothetical protein